jgi:transposase-like protein
MSVRDTSTASYAVGSTSKARALAELRSGPGTLSELARRTEVSKSALRGALEQLILAHIVLRTSNQRFELTTPGARFVEGLLELDALNDSDAAPLASFAGQWVATDEGDRVIAASPDPKELVANLRQLGLVSKWIMRVPERGAFDDSPVA